MKRDRSTYVDMGSTKESKSDPYESKSESCQPQETPGKGLDLGTGNVVSAYYKDNSIQTYLIRDAFCVIDADKHKLKMLKDRSEDYILKDDKIYLIGEKAKVYANIFGNKYPLRRPLAKGVLNPDEKDSHFVIREILKSLLGTPKIENEIVYFSVPAEPLDATFNQVFHENKAISLLNGLGYDARPINEAKCIIYAEGADTNYSAASLSFGAGMCLRHDTKVPLLNGQIKTMKELAEEYRDKQFWVFSCKEDGSIVPGLASNPHKVKHAEIIRIWLDNDEYLDCTHDHKIMLRDGQYKEAKDLIEGESLMPLYIKPIEIDGRKGYSGIKDNKTDRWNSIHRLMYRRMHNVELTKDNIIHHIDCNPANNAPDNLQLVNRAEHQEIHRTLCKWIKENLKGNTYQQCFGEEKAEEIRQKQRISARKSINNGRWKKGVPSYNSNTKLEDLFGEEKALKIKSKISKNVTISCTGIKRIAREIRKCLCGCGYEKEVTVTSKWQWHAYHKPRTKKSVSQETKEKISNSLKIAMNKPETREKFIKRMQDPCFRQRRSESAKRMWQKPEIRENIMAGLRNYHNHKVTKIEFLNVQDDVYDFTVEKYHNFAIDSGIFVHNCNFALSFEGDSSDLEFSLTKPGKDKTKFESYGCGDWIDINAASAIGKEVHEIIDIKEERDSSGIQKLNLLDPQTEEHFAIAVYYKNLIKYAVANMKNGIDNLRNIPRISIPIPIFISGGTSMAPGFIQLFEQEMKRFKWPFEIAEIKHVDPLRSVATGALIAAISEYGNE